MNFIHPQILQKKQNLLMLFTMMKIMLTFLIVLTMMLDNSENVQMELLFFKFNGLIQNYYKWHRKKHKQ